MMRRFLPLLPALLVLLLGLGAIVVRDAPASSWTVPIGVGSVVSGYTVVEVQRHPQRVTAVLERDQRRVRVDVHDEATWTGTEGIVAGRYRLVGGFYDEGPGPPVEVVQILADQVTAWEAGWPRPPRFLEVAVGRGTREHGLQRTLLDLVLLSTLCGLLVVSRELARPLREVKWRTWLGLASVVTGATALVHQLGLYGVWHANQHGFDRVSDLELGRDAGSASLALLHGFAFYALHEPIAALTGLDPFGVGTLFGLTALVLLFVWARLILEDDDRALGATAVAASSVVWLRVAPTESLYGPALVLLLLTLVLFELHLKQDRALWFVLGAGALVATMQSRAELMVLAPAWLGLSMLLRRPDWLSTAWRRPPLWLAGLGAIALMLPRFSTFLATQDPSKSGAFATETWGWMRAMGPPLVAWFALVWHPVAQRLDRRIRFGVPLLMVLMARLGHWRFGQIGQGTHTHPLLDVSLTFPLVSLLAFHGAFRLAQERDRTTSWLLAMLASGLFVYMPLQDCFSTYLRTAMILLPTLAVLAASGLPEWARRWGPLVLVFGNLVWAWPVLSMRYVKQQEWDLLTTARALIPRDAVLVWLSEADVPREATGPGWHLSRFHLDRYQPGHVVLGIEAWERGEAPADRPAYFLQTADCYRMPLSTDGRQRALLGDDMLEWRLAPLPVITTKDRLELLPAREDLSQPACQRMMQRTVESLVELTPSTANMGSVYEQLWHSRPILGLYRLK